MRSVRTILFAVAATIGLLMPLLPAASASASVIRVVPGGGTITLSVMASDRRPSAVFAAAVGDRLVVTTTRSYLPEGTVLALVRPGGSTALTIPIDDEQRLVSLPRIGTAGDWSLVVRAAPGETGEVFFSLSRFTGPTRALTLGTATQVSLPRAGEVQLFSFSTVEQRRMAMTIVRQSWAGPPGPGGTGRVYGYLYRPDGTLWGGFGVPDCGSCTDRWEPGLKGFSDDTGLTDVDGPWLLAFRAAPGNVGSMTFTLDAVADQQAAITPGAVTDVAIPIFNQRVRYTFAGRKGQHAAVSVFDESFVSDFGLSGVRATMTLFRPDGSVGIDWRPFNQPPDAQFFGGWPLDVDGTWTLEVWPEAHAVGTQKMVFDLSRDPAPATMSAGVPVKVSFGRIGMTRDLIVPPASSFPVGTHPVLEVTNASWRAPSGGGANGSGSATIGGVESGPPPTVLPSRGSGLVDLTDYLSESQPLALHVRAVTDSLGSATFTIRYVTDVTGTMTYGVPFTATIGTRGADGVYALTVPGPPRSGFVRLVVQGSTFPTVQVRVTDLDGTRFTNSGDLPSGDSDTLSFGTILPSRVLVEIDPAGVSTGSMTLTLTYQ